MGYKVRDAVGSRNGEVVSSITIPRSDIVADGSMFQSLLSREVPVGAEVSIDYDTRRREYIIRFLVPAELKLSQIVEAARDLTAAGITAPSQWGETLWTQSQRLQNAASGSPEEDPGFEAVIRKHYGAYNYMPKAQPQLLSNGNYIQSFTVYDKSDELRNRVAVDIAPAAVAVMWSYADIVLQIYGAPVAKKAPVGFEAYVKAVFGEGNYKATEPVWTDVEKEWTDVEKDEWEAGDPDKEVYQEFAMINTSDDRIDAFANVMEGGLSGVAIEKWSNVGGIWEMRLSGQEPVTDNNDWISPELVASEVAAVCYGRKELKALVKDEPPSPLSYESYVRFIYGDRATLMEARFDINPRRLTYGIASQLVAAGPVTMCETYVVTDTTVDETQKLYNIIRPAKMRVSADRSGSAMAGASALFKIEIEGPAPAPFNPLPKP